MSSWYAVQRDSDKMYYRGNGEFIESAIFSARFNFSWEATSAAKNLNEQGYCDGTCRAKLVTVSGFHSEFPEAISGRSEIY